MTIALNFLTIYRQNQIFKHLIEKHEEQKLPLFLETVNKKPFPK